MRQREQGVINAAADRGRPILLGILLALAAGFVQNILWRQLEPLVWFLFYPAAFFAALFGGLEAGIAATTAAVLIVWYVFFEPRFSFALADPQKMGLSMIGFTVMGTAFALVLDRYRRRLSEQTAREAVFEADKRFHDSISAIKDYAIFTTSPEGRITSWNDGAKQIKGYEEGEIMGRSLDVFLTPEGVAAGGMTALLECARRDGRVQCQDWRVRKDGSRFQANILLTANYDRLGKLVGFTKIVQDITELKAAEAFLQESEARARTILNAVPQLILLVDAQGRILLSNERSTTVLGYNAKELLDRPVEVLIPPRYRDAHPGHRQEYTHRPISRLMGNGRDLAALHKDGTEIPVEIGLAPVHGRKEPTFVVSLADISQRKAFEEALKLREEDTRNLAYAASHDLKAPTSTLQLLLQQLDARLEAGDTKAGRQLVRIGFGTIARMRELIEKLAEYSRVVAKAPVREEINLERLIGTVLIDLSQDRDKTKAKVVVGELPLIRGDPVHFRAIFQNLLSNAMRYGKPGTAPFIAVSASETPASGLISLHVKDDGIGIAPEFHARVFEMFQRLHVHGDISGSGLGLFICRRIVQGYGGDVRIRSELGQGAEFVIELPLTMRVT